MDNEDLFGNSDSRLMPEHFFDEALLVNHDTAIRAKIEKQKYCVAPRYWYVDVQFSCQTCHRAFFWTADEQKVWFEEYRMWVDAQPVECKPCIAAKRRLTKLQQDYNTVIGSARSGVIEEKKRVVEIVSDLIRSGVELPEKMIATKTLFEQQIAKAG